MQCPLRLSGNLSCWVTASYGYGALTGAQVTGTFGLVRFNEKRLNIGVNALAVQVDHYVGEGGERPVLTS